LNAEDFGVQGAGAGGSAGEAEGGVEFVDGAVGFEAEVGLGDAAVEEEAAGAIIASFGGDGDRLEGFRTV